MCENFLKSSCGFRSRSGAWVNSNQCSYLHPISHTPPNPPSIPPLFPHHLLHHPLQPPYLPGPFIPASSAISSRVEHLENLVQKIVADLDARGTEIAENKNKITKDTEVDEQAKLDEEQKPDMQNILTVFDDNFVNNDEIETLELSQQKKSWWTPWLKTQPSPTSLATPGGQEGTLVPPAHHTPSDHSANLKQLEVDIMNLQQNLSSLEVNFKNQKSIIDALSDNHIRCNEIKQELETNITQRFDSLDMDKQFTDLDRKIEQNTQKINNLNKVDDAQFTLYLNKVDNAQESVANLETRMQTRLQDIEENFGNLATATKTLQTQSRQAKINLEQNKNDITKLQTRVQDLEKVKPVRDKEDFTNITTTNQTSQKQIGERIAMQNNTVAGEENIADLSTANTDPSKTKRLKTSKKNAPVELHEVAQSFDTHSEPQKSNQTSKITPHEAALLVAQSLNPNFDFLINHPHLKNHPYPGS